MRIHEVELMHGAVLAKLCRSDKPVTLRLIETQDDLRPAYWINDVVLYMKHSVAPRKRKRGERERWQFTFTQSHIADLADLVQEADVYLVLICGQPEFKGAMEIAMLEPGEWQGCLALVASGQQWLAVEAEAHKGLRVYGSCSDDNKIVVARNRLETWVVPGS
jgi:hypothetical protein